MWRRSGEKIRSRLRRFVSGNNQSGRLHTLSSLLLTKVGRLWEPFVAATQALTATVSTVLRWCFLSTLRGAKGKLIGPANGMPPLPIPWPSIQRARLWRTFLDTRRFPLSLLNFLRMTSWTALRDYAQSTRQPRAHCTSFSLFLQLLNSQLQGLASFIPQSSPCSAECLQFFTQLKPLNKVTAPRLEQWGFKTTWKRT